MTAATPAHGTGTCLWCAKQKALYASGVVGLHYVPAWGRDHAAGKVRRRCPGSFRAPREVTR